MSDPIPPPPVRVPTPTLDALYQKYNPGAPRFFTEAPPALGERDFALELYQSRKMDTTQQQVSDEDYAAVSPVDVLNAKTYPILYAKWCTDYNGGFAPIRQDAEGATGTSPNGAPPASPYLLPAPTPPSALTTEQIREALATIPPLEPPKPPVVPAPVVPPKPSFGARVLAFLKRHLT